MTFDYPHPRTKRRHGPAAYTSYKSYHPWLRDEFDFRCVYCLKRETWGQVTGDFEIDHFQPQSLHAARRLDYLNLVYACRRCNAVKLDQTVADPLLLLNSERVVTLPDGSLHATDADVQRLILQLDLNSPRLREWRTMWMRIVALAATQAPELHLQLLGFPPDLPNLARLRPPHNSQPGGLRESWFAKRQRAELPATY